MDFLAAELRDKPIIGIISGVGAWVINSINTTAILSDNHIFWDLLSKFGILMGSLIAVLTFMIKAKEFYNLYFKKGK